MVKMDTYLFLVTVPNFEVAKKVARILVEHKLAACVNIIQNVFSIYQWKNNIQEDTELLLFIKTTEEKCNSIIQKIKEIHPYEVPECIGFKIEKGLEKYLNWIQEVVK